MPRNDIIARLRLKGVARFVAESKIAERAVKGIHDAAEDGGGVLNNMGGAIGEMASKLPDVTGRTRIFGFAVGTVVTALVAAIPLVVGLGGAAVAVAGSLGQAALGAGALGVAAAGAAVPLGILGLVAVDAFQGFQKVNTAFNAWQVAVGMYGRNSVEAETALSRMNSIAKMMGGETLVRLVVAFDKLQKVFRQMNRGTMQIIYRFLMQLVDAAQLLMPVLADVAKTVATALTGAFQYFITEITSANFQQLLRDLASVFAMLAGPLVRAATNFLMGFLELARRMAPLLQWVANGIERLSMSFRSWAESGDISVLVSQFKSWVRLIGAVGRLLFAIFGAGAKEGQSLVDTLTRVINKWTAWFKTAEGQKSLLSFFKDAGEMTKSFAVFFGKFLGVIFKFGKMMLPIYKTVFDTLVKGVAMLKEAIAPAEPFFRNILGPLLKGLAKGVITGVVGAFKFLAAVLKIVSRALGWLGDKLSFLKGPLELIGQILGFVFGGGLLRTVAAILGKMSILLKPLAGLFRLLAIPIQLAGKAVGFLFGWLGKIASWIGSTAAKIFAPLKNAFEGVVNWLVGAGRKVFDTLAGIWRFFANGVKEALGSVFGFLEDIFQPVVDIVNWIIDKVQWVIDKLDAINPFGGPSFDERIGDQFGAKAVEIAMEIIRPIGKARGLPGFAEGGVVSGKGSWISGEAGPELNTFAAGKVMISPLADWNLSDLPMLASGGLVSGTGSWITGEAGPEVNTLRDGKVVVQPLTPAVSAQATNATLAPTEGKRTIVTKIYLKGRQIAEAVADEVDDERARR